MSMKKNTRAAQVEESPAMQTESPELITVRKSAKKKEPTKELIETVEKTSVEDDEEFFELHKDITGALRKARLAADISEGTVAAALGISTDDYVALEQGADTAIQIKPEAFKALAKAFKMPVENLAAELLSTPDADDGGASQSGSQTSGDVAQPPTDDPAVKSARSRLVKTEKSTLRSVQPSLMYIREPIPNADLGDMSLEKRKHVAAQRFTKSFFSAENYARIQKSGIITADMFGPNPSIDPVIANTLINVMVDESALLKQMQTKVMSGKKQNVNVMDVPSRTATRLVSGAWPGAGAGTTPINGSLQLNAEKLQFMWQIDDDTLAAYIGNLPALESELTGGFTKALPNDILDLGLNSIGGAYTNNFLNLNQGWLSLLETGGEGISAAAPAGQIITQSTYAPAFTTVEGMFDAMLDQAYSLANGNARFFGDDTPFLIGTQDWRTHTKQLKANHPTFPIPINGLEQKYEGRTVHTTNKGLAPYTGLFTNLLNLVVGIVTGTPGQSGDGITVERFRVIGATIFVATVYLDFGVVNNKAAVVVKPT